MIIYSNGVLNKINLCLITYNFSIALNNANFDITSIYILLESLPNEKK